jgi:hypothetical protein
LWELSVRDLDIASQMELHYSRGIAEGVAAFASK